MYPQIILLGDSITQGMTTTIQAWLQTRYIRRADIINRGFSGYTSSQVLTLLPQIIPSPYPSNSPPIRLYIIFLGANDAFIPPPTPESPRVPLETFTFKIRELISYPTFTAQKTKIVLITPPPVDEYSLPHTGLTSERVARYADSVREIGKELKVPVVDCSRAFARHIGWKADEADKAAPLPGSRKLEKSNELASLFTDGLHFSNKGYEVLFHEIVKVLEEEVPEVSFDNLPVLVCKFCPMFLSFGNLYSLQILC